MIESLEIKDVATFGNTGGNMEELKKINFIFGSNGTGKTVISKLINNPDSYGECTINWAGNNPINRFVYNQDFVDKNFHTDNPLKGIFTLGENNAQLNAEINEVNKEIDDLESKLRTLDDGKVGKIAEKEKLEEEFRERIWKDHQEYRSNFNDIFIGFKNNKRKFAEQLIKGGQDNSTKLRTLEYLQERTRLVFQQNPNKINEFNIPDASRLLEVEINNILKKKIIGREDVNIAEMIHELGNSDWVREGLTYFEKDNEHCPFCQRRIEESFRTSLEEYFNEEFKKNLESIRDLRISYKEQATQLIEEYEDIKNSENFLDFNAFEVKLDLFKDKIQINNSRLSQKEKEPSIPINLAELSDIISDLKEIIETVNRKIREHNEFVDNQEKLKKDIKQEMWCFLAKEARVYIDTYQKSLSDIEIVINQVNEEIKQIRNNLSEVRRKKTQFGKTDY